MLTVDQRLIPLLNESKQEGGQLRRPPPRLELKTLPPAAPQKPIQALDTIEFEELYKKNQIELAQFNLDHNPEELKNAHKIVPFKEKLIISATYILSSIGTGLSCTIGIMTKFGAPIGIGGAGLAIGGTLLIGLTAGCGVVAIALAYFVRKYYTKEALKNAGLLIRQIKLHDKKLDEKQLKVDQELYKSFSMLLKMQLELNTLQRDRLTARPPDPSLEERALQTKLNDYINFLVIDPDHPNLQSIESGKKRIEAHDRAAARQNRIQVQLKEACKQIELKQTTINEYIQKHPCEVRQCFPSLHLVAPKIKPTVREVLFTPSVGLSALGGFTGAFGLSYSTLGIITIFAVIPMAFPPLYAILGVGLLVGLMMGCAMYNIKATEYRRKAHHKNQQKYLAYLTRADNLLSERYTHELEDYVSYRSAYRTAPITRPTSLPDLRKVPDKQPDVSPLSIFTKPLSEPVSDLSFRDPSQLSPDIIRTAGTPEPYTLT